MAFFAGMERAVVGARLGDISAAVQEYAESAGYSVVRDFVGHGIGENLHEDPNVPNFGTAGRGARICRGMVIAVEPMVNAGRPEVSELPDHWTVVTKDGSLSAHYEHTIAITENGPELLTKVN
jgi:methionyl aminopeptidase